MLNEIKSLIEKYEPKSYGRLVSCRPALKEFLQEWNQSRQCTSTAEQFFCIKFNIEPPLCKCGKKLLFSSFVKGYRGSCGTIECKYKNQAASLSSFWEKNPETKERMMNNQQKAIREKYGVVNIMQSPEFLSDLRAKNLSNTGFSSPLENPTVQEKCSTTLRERYGVDRPFQSPEIREKAAHSYELGHGYPNKMEEARTEANENRLREKNLREQVIKENRIITRRQNSSRFQREINEVRPYTYLIKFKPTGQVYYGVRSKNIDKELSPLQDFMVGYTTSSEQINNLIKEHGIESFEYEIRRTFDTPEQAYFWEQAVLRRCKVVSDPRWFNQNAGGHIETTPMGRERISKYHSGTSKSPEHRAKISASLLGKSKRKPHYLTMEQVREIRNTFNRAIHTNEDFAKLYGVSSTCISNILHYHTWKNI